MRLHLRLSMVGITAAAIGLGTMSSAMAAIQGLSGGTVTLNFRADLARTFGSFGSSVTDLPRNATLPPLTASLAVKIPVSTGTRDTTKRIFQLNLSSTVRLAFGKYAVTFDRCRLESSTSADATGTATFSSFPSDFSKANPYIAVLICTSPGPNGEFSKIASPVIRFVGDPYGGLTTGNYPVSMVLTAATANAVNNRAGKTIVTEGYFLGTAIGQGIKVGF
jgi:hypothetical protein